MRPLLYLWALPNTVLGLLVVAVAALGGDRARTVTGVLEAHGRTLAWLLRRFPIRGGASAMTLGHVVLGRDLDCLERTRDHERVHVRQYELWGPLFLPAYLLSSLVAALRGKDFYRDNVFEREAFRKG
jgi:hypothetical protein